MRTGGIASAFFTHATKKKVAATFSSLFFCTSSKLRNKIGDNLLDDYLVTYIERDVFNKVNEDDIIKAFMALAKKVFYFFSCKLDI